MATGTDRLALRAFISVVENGNFSRAARQLGLAPSSVNREIGLLEQRLGVRLFNRSTRRMGLTEAGTLYYQRVSRILADLDDADLSVGRLAHSPRGVLHLSMSPVFGRLYVAPMLPAFLARYPEISIDLTLTDRYLDLLAEGIDVAIRIGDLKDSQLVAKRLAPHRGVICAAAAYLARRGKPEAPEDLTRHNCLTYKFSQPANSVWRLKKEGATREIKVSGNLQADDVEALHAAAVAGLGLALLPQWLAKQALESGELRAVLTDYQASASAGERAIFAVYPFGRNLLPKVRAFLDFLAAEFGNRRWTAE